MTWQWVVLILGLFYGLILALVTMAWANDQSDTKQQNCHLMDDYDNICDVDEHDWNIQRLVCYRCGITAEQVAAGRDHAPTWEEVDTAFKDGQNLGIELGIAQYREKRRRKLIEVGYYLCLRNLGNSIERKQ